MNGKERSREFVNLLVELDERFSGEATQRAIARVRDAGLAVVDMTPPDERYLSWIDLVFDGTWSGEAASGAAIVLLGANDSGPVGFASYGASGLRFYWLRAWENREDVGILGPIGIVPQHRTPALQEALLTITLDRMREAGYRYALIPAVTEPILDSLVSATGGKVVERFSMDRIAPDIRTTVMASGSGTNFQAVIDELPNGIGLDIKALVVNRPGAFAIERAKRAGIPVHVHAWDRRTTSREAYDAALIDLIERTQPELILMLGWMHLVSPDFFTRLPPAINIHPAFLPHDTRADTVAMPDGSVIPAFRGAHGIRDAIAVGSRWYGATAHYVTFDLDRGRVLKRAPLPLLETDEERALAALRPTEHAVILGGIRRMLAER